MFPVLQETVPSIVMLIICSIDQFGFDLGSPRPYRNRSHRSEESTKHYLVRHQWKIGRINNFESKSSPKLKQYDQTQEISESKGTKIPRINIHFDHCSSETATDFLSTFFRKFTLIRNSLFHLVHDGKINFADAQIKILN